MAEQLSLGFWDASPVKATPEPSKPKTKKREASKPRNAKTPRRCLCCSKTFPSHGPGNRICSDCRYGDRFSGPTEFSTSISF